MANPPEAWDPTPAQKTAIIADLLDSCDPRNSAAIKQAAFERAADIHTDFALLVAWGLLGATLAGLRDQYDEAAFADVMRQLKVTAERMFDGVGE